MTYAMNQRQKRRATSPLSRQQRGTSNMFYRSLIFLVVMALACAGCTRRSSGGISSGTGGFPPSSVTPVTGQISSSAEVVKVTTSPVHGSPGSSADAVVRLAITPGYHVNANPATYSYLIATEVQPGNIEGLSVGMLIYPTATKQKFEFAEEPL